MQSYSWMSCEWFIWHVMSCTIKIQYSRILSIYVAHQSDWDLLKWTYHSQLWWAPNLVKFALYKMSPNSSFRVNKLNEMPIFMQCLIWAFVKASKWLWNVKAFISQSALMSLKLFSASNPAGLQNKILKASFINVFYAHVPFYNVTLVWAWIDMVKTRLPWRQGGCDVVSRSHITASFDDRDTSKLQKWSRVLCWWFMIDFCLYVDIYFSKHCNLY